jgi:hypothetical protein
MELKVVEQKIATKRIFLRKLEAKNFVHTQHLSDFLVRLSTSSSSVVNVFSIIFI